MQTGSIPRSVRTSKINDIWFPINKCMFLFIYFFVVVVFFFFCFVLFCFVFCFVFVPHDLGFVKRLQDHAMACIS